MRGGLKGKGRSLQRVWSALNTRHGTTASFIAAADVQDSNLYSVLQKVPPTYVVLQEQKFVKSLQAGCERSHRLTIIAIDQSARANCEQNFKFLFLKRRRSCDLLDTLQNKDCYLARLQRQ